MYIYIYRQIDSQIDRQMQAQGAPKLYIKNVRAGRRDQNKKIPKRFCAKQYDPQEIKKISKDKEKMIF